MEGCSPARELPPPAGPPTVPGLLLSRRLPRAGDGSPQHPHHRPVPSVSHQSVFCGLFSLRGRPYPPTVAGSLIANSVGSSRCACLAVFGVFCPANFIAIKNFIFNLITPISVKRFQSKSQSWKSRICLNRLFFGLFFDL